jgi:serine/threonine protein kinase
MEHITGGSLKEYLEQTDSKTLSESEVQRLMYELGIALDYCHQRRIVHRDIKLENIMLRERGNLSKGIVLIDFGIAGLMLNSREHCEEGTLRYAPPELLTGSSYKADSSFDVWSLGILLYKLVFGKFPFDGPYFNDIKQSIIKDIL